MTPWPACMSAPETVAQVMLGHLLDAERTRSDSERVLAASGVIATRVAG